MKKSNLETVKKAKGVKVQPIWMALSKEDLSFEKRLCVTDIFVQLKDNGSGVFEKSNPTKIWEILASVGIYVHPALKEQYARQLTCIWCNGMIVRETVNELNWEDRCSSCGFMYAEG